MPDKIEYCRRLRSITGAKYFASIHYENPKEDKSYPADDIEECKGWVEHARNTFAHDSREIGAEILDLLTTEETML